MYVLIKNNAVEAYPYSAAQLLSDNPGTSFPSHMTDDLLAEHGVFPVQPSPQPKHDPLAQDLAEAAPSFLGGVWVQKWAVTPAPADEVAQRKAAADERMKVMRARAFAQEADPLFFKAQRGEGNMAEWQAKVDEIRARYPYTAN